MMVADIDYPERHSAFGCRGSDGVDVEVGEPQQGEAEPEEVEDRLAVLEEQAGRTCPGLSARCVGVHVIGWSCAWFVADDRRAIVSVSEFDSVGFVFEIAQVEDLSAQASAAAFAVPALGVNDLAVGGFDRQAHQCVPRRRCPVADRHGATLGFIGLEQAMVSPALHDRGEHPAQPDGITYTGVHAVAAGRHDLVH